MKITYHTTRLTVLLFTLFSVLVSRLYAATYVTPEESLAFLIHLSTGQIPIETLVVEREIIDNTRHYVDYYRFHCQRGTWAAEEYVPTTNTPSPPTNLIPLNGGTVFGASLTHIWRLNSNLVDIAHFDVAPNSVPARASGRALNALTDVLGIGMPFSTPTSPRWDGMTITRSPPALIPSFEQEDPKAHSSIGTLTIGGDGYPSGITFTSSIGAGTVELDYSSHTIAYPTRITRRFSNKSLPVAILTILSLTTNYVDLGSTGGYVPQLFADASHHRAFTVYTNAVGYGAYDGVLVPDTVTKDHRMVGQLTFAVIALATGTLFTLLLKRERRK